MGLPTTMKADCIYVLTLMTFIVMTLCMSLHASFDDRKPNIVGLGLLFCCEAGIVSVSAYGQTMYAEKVQQV